MERKKCRRILEKHHRTGKSLSAVALSEFNMSRQALSADRKRHPQVWFSTEVEVLEVEINRCFREINKHALAQRKLSGKIYQSPTHYDDNLERCDLLVVFAERLSRLLRRQHQLFSENATFGHGRMADVAERAHTAAYRSRII